MATVLFILKKSILDWLFFQMLDTFWNGLSPLHSFEPDTKYDLLTTKSKSPIWSDQSFILKILGFPATDRGTHLTKILSTTTIHHLKLDLNFEHFFLIMFYCWNDATNDIDAIRLWTKLFCSTSENDAINDIYAIRVFGKLMGFEKYTLPNKIFLLSSSGHTQIVQKSFVVVKNEIRRCQRKT